MHDPHAAAQPLLDHMVVNTRFQMDAAAAAFAALGFQLTPRGHHTLGSINHLAVLATDYLELIGLPPGEPVRRAEIAAAPVGIDGLVFKSADVDATYRHLCALDMDGDPPRAFSRPVEVDGVHADAAFRTVAVRAGLFPARVYFCEHLTPELIWRPAWQRHANGAASTAEFVIGAADAATQAARYAALLQRPCSAVAGAAHAIDVGGARLVVLDPRASDQRFGALMAGRADGFLAISLRSRDLQAARRHAEAAAVGPVQVETGRVVVRLEAFDTVLEFIA